MLDTSFCKITNVKKQFFKTGGIECYHGYQSFAENEVTPEQAHEIGVKLAEELKHCNNIQKRICKTKEIELHNKLEKEKEQFQKDALKKQRNKSKDR